MSRPNLCVVIVNYRTGKCVLDCLRALAAECRATGTRAIVVDNASPDDSAAVIEAAIASEGWADFAELQRSPKNGGFAWGNNFAVRPLLRRADTPRYFLLLNPDTVVEPRALTALVEFMDAHPKAGIGGSQIFEADGSPWSLAFRFPSAVTELDSGFRLGLVTRLLKDRVLSRKMGDVPEKVDWVSGASFIVRREVFEWVGLMDERYFLYFEEVDFCFAAQRAGWECWYIPGSRVMHIAGAATGVTVRTDKPRRVPAYWFESRRRFYTQNYGTVHAAAADLAYIVGHATWRVRRRLQNKPDTDPESFLKDFVRHSLLSPKAPRR